LIDREGDDFASPDWRGVLASIGIVKGQPFNPDARTRKILEQGAVTGFKTARVLANEVVLNGVSTLVYPDRKWTNPFPSGSSTKQLAINTAFLNASGHFLDLDSRAGYYSMSWGISPSMVKEATPTKGGFTASPPWTTRVKRCRAIITTACTFRPISPRNCSGRSRFTMPIPPRCWPVRGSSRPSPQLKSRCRTTTAARTSISAQARRAASPVIGCLPSPVETISLSYASMAQQKQPWTRAGNQATSNA